MADTDIKIVITAEDKASGIFSTMSNKVGGLSGAMGTLAKVAGGALVAGFGALTTLAITSVDAFEEQDKALKQLDAVLTSTKDASGLTRDELISLSGAMQKLTTYSDESVLSAENLLLTFTNIKGPTFKDATKIVLDMSTALGQDLKSSAIQVGKALQDPILGVTALRRVGVNFNETQMETIKHLVNTGQSMQAQKLILQELNTEFGGSASKAAETFGGKLQQLKNSLNDMQETIGSAIVTAITPFITQLTEWAAKPETQEKVKQIAQAMANFATQMAPIVEKLLPVFITLMEGVGKGILAVANFLFKTLPDAIGTAIFAIQQIIDKITSLVQKIEEALSKLKSLVSAPTGGTLNPFSQSFSLPSWVPKFASGGIVSRPTLAMVGEGGEPEAIVPLSKMGGLGGGIYVSITGNTISNSLDLQNIADAVGDAIMDKLRLNHKMDI